MVQHLEIQGELVQLVERNVVRQMKLQEFMPHLVKELPVTLPTLPLSARFVHYDPTNPIAKIINVLCEVPAGIRTITKDNTHNGSKRRYKLAFPWTYFWMTAVSQGTRMDSFVLNNYKCFHARERYTKPPGELFVAFLPNIYAESGEICFGNTAETVGSLADQIDGIVNNFFVTEFNDHLDGSEMVFPFGGSNFKNWVDATEQYGASAWKRFPEWESGVRTKFTIEDLIEGSTKLRTTDIKSSIVIPEIPAPMTFGLAEEWLMNLTSQQRGRLKVAMANIKDENPEAIDETPQVVTEVTEDGGVPV